MARVVPAKINTYAVPEGAHDHAFEMYVRNGKRYRDELRRID